MVCPLKTRQSYHNASLSRRPAKNKAAIGSALSGDNHRARRMEHKNLLVFSAFARLRHWYFFGLNPCAVLRSHTLLHRFCAPLHLMHPRESQRSDASTVAGLRIFDPASKANPAPIGMAAPLDDRRDPPIARIG
jgi:hypothetical protein